MTGDCCLNSGIQFVSNYSLVFRFAYNLFDVNVNAAVLWLPGLYHVENLSQAQ